MKTRQELINQIGFVNNVTEDVTLKLKSKTTKAAKEVADKIEEYSTYRIFTSDEQFTVLSPWLVTKQEIKQIKQIIKLEYIQLEVAMENNNIRSEWLDASK